MPVRKISSFLTLLLIVVIAFVAYYLIKTKPEPQAVLEKTQPVSVSVVSIETRDIQPIRVVSGRLQAAKKLGLHFEVSGRVESRSVEPGQSIKAGEPLLALEEGDYRDMVVDAQAQLDQERSAVARDRRLLEIAKRNTELQSGEVKRLERLSSNSLAAQSLLDEARKLLLQLRSEQESLSFSVDSAKSRIDLRESALRRAQRNLDRTRLSAPFDSVINSVAVDVGDFMTTAEVAVELFEQDKFDLSVEVDGETARALNLQQAVPVKINGSSQTGKVVALQSDPDSETFTHALRIRVHGEGLLPGMLASTELPLLAQRNVLTAPVTAILQEDGKAYLFKVVDSQLQRLTIEVGIRHGDHQVVAGNLGTDDVIVKRDVAALSDGQFVTVLK